MCETPPTMILHTHTNIPIRPLIGLIHAAIITAVE
jgi:hypothetical protein